ARDPGGDEREDGVVVIALAGQGASESRVVIVTAAGTDLERAVSRGYPLRIAILAIFANQLDEPIRRRSNVVGFADHRMSAHVPQNDVAAGRANVYAGSDLGRAVTDFETVRIAVVQVPAVVAASVDDIPARELR